MSYVIYKICCDNCPDYAYIGSTTNFRQRKSAHKMMCNSETNKHYNLKVYQTIRDNGGWDAHRIVVIEELGEVTKLQAHIREEQLRIELNGNMNTVRAYVTDELHKVYQKEYYKLNKDHRKEYYELNKDLFRVNHKQYYELNKDIIKDKKKQYRELNKDLIKDKAKQYRELNKDLIKDKAKQYRELNKDKIRVNRTEYNELNKDKAKQYYELNKDIIKDKARERYKKKKLIIKEILIPESIS